MKWVKRIALTLVIVFALFYLLTKPREAADVVTSAVGVVVNALGSLGTFFSNLA